MCLDLIRDEGGGGGGGWGRGDEQLDRALRPAKTEETVSHRQNNDVKGGGDPASAKQTCVLL